MYKRQGDVQVFCHVVRVFKPIEVHEIEFNDEWVFQLELPVHSVSLVNDPDNDEACPGYIEYESALERMLHVRFANNDDDTAMIDDQIYSRTKSTPEEETTEGEAAEEGTEEEGT